MVFFYRYINGWPAQIFEAIIEAEQSTNYTVAPIQPIAVDASIAKRLINACSESVAEKPSFRDSFRSRRCLIIADGFYEWQTKDGVKKPFFIFMKDRRPFGIAGLYDHWKDENGKEITTCTIITTEANEFMKALHDRMPAIINPKDYDLWLDPAEKDASKISSLMKPWGSMDMDAYEVSTLVNSAGHNSAECIDPIHS